MIVYVGWSLLREHWITTKNIAYEVTRPSSKASIIRILAAIAYAVTFTHGIIYEVIIIAAIGADILYSYRDYVASV